MARICSICEKQLKLMDVYVHLKDGLICKDCCEKFGYKIPSFQNTSKLSKMTKAELLQQPSSTETLPPIPEKSAYKQLEMMVIQNPPISLKKGEVCFYEGDAQAIHIKNVVVGSKSKGSGASIRVAKGLSFHTGGGGSKTIRKDVVERFNGNLYLTNMRIVLLTPKFGFDLPILKITQFSKRSDGFIIYSGSNSYSVGSKDTSKIVSIINLMDQAFDEQEQNVTQKSQSIKKSNSKASSQTDPYEEIKKLKELFDMGIITEDEFKAKKKKLLDI